jgi:hypothetical protein
MMFNFQVRDEIGRLPGWFPQPIVAEFLNLTNSEMCRYGMLLS